MKKEIADLWVQALRSGKYSQLQGMLHEQGSGFCCLGVLCDVHREQTGAGEWDDAGYYITNRTRESGLLPAAVIDWAGTADSNPDVTVPDDELGKSCLTMLNDDKGYTFAQIADLIEQHWEEL